MARLTMTEDQLSKAVVALAETLRWSVYGVQRSDKALLRSGTGVGFPDLLLLRNGKVLAVELKRHDRALPVEQQHWLEELEAVPGIRSLVWRPRDWLSGEVEQVLRDT